MLNRLIKLYSSKKIQMKNLKYKRIYQAKTLTFKGKMIIKFKISKVILKIYKKTK